MIDRKTNETAWDVMTSRPTVSAVAPSSHPIRKRCMQPRPHQLAHDIRAICRRNPQGAHRTQIDRLRALLLCAKQLDMRKKVVNLTADDICLLVNKWHADKLSPFTIRFRLVCLRWLSKKIGKPKIVGSDRAYGVDRSAK